MLASYAGDASRTASQSAITVLTGLNQTATTTTLSYAPNPAYAAQTLTFTANVYPLPTGAPLGTVAFYNGATLIVTSAVNAQGVATFVLTNVIAGSGTTYAVYSGNPDFGSSTSAGLTVTVAATQLAVSGIPSTLAAGGNLGTAIATIENTSGAVITTSSAAVVMTIAGPGGYLQAVSATAVNGVATFNLSSIVLTAAGTYTVTATSSGLPSAIFTVIVSGTTTATSATVTSSNLAPTYGQSVTITAAITPASTDTPPGTIKFYTGTNLLGTQAVSAQGIATLNISLPLGANPVTVVYSGSAGYSSSTSAVLSISNRAATTITISANPATQLATMAIAFTTQVSSAAAGTQTGSISVFNGSTVLATLTILAGQPTVHSETSLSSGTYSVIATYSGDSNFLPGASTGAPATISVSDLNLALGGDNNKSVVPGGAVAYNFPLSPVVTPTFIYDVALTATGLPPGATYTFSPATIPAGSGTLPVAFTAQTAKTTALLHRNSGSSNNTWFALGFGLLLPLVGIRRFRASLSTAPRLLLIILFGSISLGLIGGLLGCGSGGFVGQPQGKPSTPSRSTRPVGRWSGQARSNSASSRQANTILRQRS